MRDVVFVLIIVAFFAIAAAYVRACGRIIGPDERQRRGAPTSNRSMASRSGPGADDRRQRHRAGARRPDHRLPGRAPCSSPRSSEMTGANWLQFAVLIALVVVATPILGRYMAKVFGADGDRAPGDRVFLPDRAGRLPRHRRRPEARAALAGLRLRRAQLQPRLGARPLPAAAGPGVAAAEPDRRRRTCPPALSFNTAVSFVTNTNWQNYAPENTVCHLTQMVGLAVQNFVSAAVGIAVAIALVRGPDPAAVGHDRQLLGRPHPSHDPHPAAARRSSFALVFVEPGDDPELRRLHRGDDARGRHPGDRRRPVRQPGGDQGARHQRRRVAQRQRRPPVREPERAHEPARRCSSSC